MTQHIVCNDILPTREGSRSPHKFGNHFQDTEMDVILFVHYETDEYEYK